MAKDETSLTVLEAGQELMIAEFNYMAQTAFQAQEDRARSSEFFLIGIGSFIAAILSSQFEVADLHTLNITFTVMFAVVATLGALTILQLRELRKAWRESVVAMNVMKDFWIAKNPALVAAFKWRGSTIPALFKPKSLGFLLTIEVSILSGIAGGASVYYGLTACDVATPLGYALAAAVVLVLVYTVGLYSLPLRRQGKLQQPLKKAGSPAPSTK